MGLVLEIWLFPYHKFISMIENVRFVKFLLTAFISIKGKTCIELTGTFSRIVSSAGFCLRHMFLRNVDSFYSVCLPQGCLLSPDVFYSLFLQVFCLSFLLFG